MFFRGDFRFISTASKGGVNQYTFLYTRFSTKAEVVRQDTRRLLVPIGAYMTVAVIVIVNFVKRHYEKAKILVLNIVSKVKVLLPNFCVFNYTSYFQNVAFKNSMSKNPAMN